MERKARSTAGTSSASAGRSAEAAALRPLAAARATVNDSQANARFYELLTPQTRFSARDCSYSNHAEQRGMGWVNIRGSAQRWIGAARPARVLRDGGGEAGAQDALDARGGTVRLGSNPPPRSAAQSSGADPPRSRAAGRRRPERRRVQAPDDAWRGKRARPGSARQVWSPNACCPEV